MQDNILSPINHGCDSTKTYCPQYIDVPFNVVHNMTLSAIQHEMSMVRQGSIWYYARYSTVQYDIVYDTS